MSEKKSVFEILNDIDVNGWVEKKTPIGSNPYMEGL